MNYSDEEKETIAHLIDMSNLSLIGDGTVIIQNETIAIVLNLIQKQDKIIDKMAEKINQAYFDEGNMWLWFEEKILPKDEFGLCEYKDLGTRNTRIKEYFKKVVTDTNVGDIPEDNLVEKGEQS